MTYQETLNWMFAQLPMYQQKGQSAFNEKLDHITAFCTHLNHPEKKFKSIHVAGTNGKGSSSHMLASVLQEAGYTVGLYTSPHLKDFRERIKINGAPISEEKVVAFIAKHKPLFKDLEMSFFEMTVGMAFAYFADEEVDIAVIEVGLGGRLDATNIIIPIVSLITNIGYDHMHFLGNTITDIATEKAGIIKEKVPVVISEFQEDTAQVFKRIAVKKDTELLFASEFIEESYPTDLKGNYQARNIKGVLGVLGQLKMFNITKDHIAKGLLNVVKNTGLLGRWQLLGERPRIICDTAHNTEGLPIVLRQLAKEKYDELHIVLGFVTDKDLNKMLPLFPKNAIYYYCKPNITRGLDAESLQLKGEALGLRGKVYSNVDTAYKVALANADDKDVVFIGGSTFVVAEVV